MDFKKFLSMMAEAESTAEKDDKAEKAGKKVTKDIEYDEGHKGKDDDNAEKAGKEITKDIEYDDKKDKKSLKDWFEIVDRNMINEAEQVTMEPAKQSTQVIKRGGEVIGSVSNPALAATIKSAIGKGEMSLAGHEMKEEALDEKWAGDAKVEPTGQYAGKTIEELKSMLSKLKKSGPHKEGSPGFKKMRQIMFAIRAKKGWKGGVNEAKAKNPYAIGMAQAMKSTGDKPPLKKSTIVKAHDIAKKIKKTNEAEIPHSGPDYGAGLGAGRSQETLEGLENFSRSDRKWMKDLAKQFKPVKTPKNTYIVVQGSVDSDEGFDIPVYYVEYNGEKVYGPHYKIDRIRKFAKQKEAEGHKVMYETYISKDKKKVDEVDISFDDVKNFYVAYKVVTEWGIPLALMAALVAGLGIVKVVDLIKQGKNALLKKYKEMKVTPDTEKINQAAKKIKDAGKKKKVDEAMNTCEAAYHEGKAHGLTKHGYSCRYDEGSEEHSHYHRGFKEGLDECYGLMPNRGLVVSEVESGADVVGNMASYGAEEGELAETSLEPKDQHFYKDMYDSDDEAKKMEGNAFTAALAKAEKGEKFTVGGKTYTDSSNYDAKIDEFAFESLDKQLNDLLNEGLSVNMSQGLGGPGAEDTVSVTAQGDDAGKLLQFIKQVGLGGLGAPEQLDGPSEPAQVAMSDYGAPKFDGYDTEKGDMMSLMKVMSGDDYKDEEGLDHDDDMPKVKMCGTHGMDEAKCGCSEGKEMVDEVESEDQMEYQVAEDDGEGNIEADEQGAQIDAALAVGSENEKAVHEDGMESSPEAAGAVAAADSDEEQEEAMSESSFLNLYKKLSWLAEESTAEKDDKAEKAGKKVAKDIEYDEGHKGKDDEKAEKAGEKVKKDIEYDDKKDKKLDEWANDAGKDGTQQSFERDIEFMTKVIAGGLNKPKSTGQQTIPVLAGDKERTGDEDMAEYKKLAGLGQ